MGSHYGVVFRLSGGAQPRAASPSGGEDRPQLQRQSGDDFAAHGLTYRHPYVGRSVIATVWIG